MKKQSLFIFALSLAVFGVITTELGIIGLLPQVMKDFNIDVQEAGLLVSVYAVVVAVSGPFITLMMSGWNRKYVLIGILSLFVLSNLVYAMTQDYTTMMIFRVLPALMHAVFFSVALVAATSMVPVEEQSNAAAKVFGGVAVGLVFGIPISAFLAEQYSLAYAFYFGLTACAIALVSVMFLMESAPVKEKMSFGSQVTILRSKSMWLSLSTVIFVFAAMFSSYSFITQYLSTVTNMNGTWISAMLMVFGVFGIFGNFIFGKLLGKNMKKTVMLYPITLGLIYLVVYFMGFSFSFMVAMVAFWGAVHSAGLVVSQTWVMDNAGDAKVFANSLYISFSNFGITIGSIVAGWFISQFGVENLFLSSLVFTVLALISILLNQKKSPALKLSEVN
ncbi:MFS transporter [Vibrio sp. AIC-3]|uniref:MFS transporter n=1 Tax=Vibrio sp. AIC-3 TaxID=2607604 RepID=UPI001493C8CE|nr:MFS transporter [Vibrio sp. AIC-3]NOH95076.1 MFS transporter [Vibrio sp. AIC-3]